MERGVLVCSLYFDPTLTQAIVVFKIDKDEWTLDLRKGKGTLKKGPSEEKANLTLTINDSNFVQLCVT